MTASANPFEDSQHVAMYAERARQMVPAFDDVHLMATILMSERAPVDGRILVLGAGGGLETKSFADACPQWTFDAVDPAKAMLDLAAAALAPHIDRVRMHHGYIDAAPTGPFDAATSLLTLHFLEPEARRDTAAQVRRRLRPGAPFIVMHMSVPQRTMPSDNGGSNATSRISSPTASHPTTRERHAKPFRPRCPS